MAFSGTSGFFLIDLRDQK